MIGSARPRWDAARETLSLAQVSQCCSCDVYAGAKSPLGLRFRRFVLRVVRASPPHAHRDRSPDRLCIPSRAASHRLNVKVGKNVYNHDARRSAEKRTSRSVSDGAEPELERGQRRRREARRARVPGPDGRASAVDAGYDRDRLGPRETCAKTEGRDGDAAVRPPVVATVGAGCLRLPCTRQGRAAAVARLTVTVD